LDKFGNAKLMELFQILLRYKKNGISRNRIMQMLYDEDSVEDRSHSLDSLVYRLKRTLEQTELAQKEFFHIKNGIYKWCEEIPMVLDVQEFETLMEKAESATAKEKKNYLVSAFYWYESEFLEDRTIRPWILEERMRLKKAYAKCVHALQKIFIEEENYQALYELCSKAAALYPYDEWQTGQIQALQHMERYTEAYNLYQSTVKKYFDELGLPPSQKMLDIIKNMGNSILNPSEPLATIKTRLSEEGDHGGAFFCTYPGFVDIYRYISRTVERSGQSIFFMVCSVYYLNPSGRKSPRAGDILQDAIGLTLRKGDSYTRYSDNQFLILLTGTQNENCEMIFERIRKEFKKRNRNSNCELEFYASSIVEITESDGKLSFKNSKSLWGNKN